MHRPRQPNAAFGLDAYQLDPAGNPGLSSEVHPSETDAQADRELDEADALELLKAVLSNKLREFVK